MEHETRSHSCESPTDTNRQEQSSKTSFLIEDILYRGQQNRNFKPPLPEHRRTYELEPKSYFPVPNEVRPHLPAREGSYLQVMGALGAYLHTPNYKSVESPYFLSQGMLKIMYIC